MNTLSPIRWCVAALLAFAAAGCAGTATTERTPSGTYTVEFDNAAGLIGFHTGQGVLTMKDGSQYAFTADGYSLIGLGYTVATSSGEVYNLKSAADINGEYAASGAAAVFVAGRGEAELRNRANDTVLSVDASESGLRLGVGGGFVTIKLGRQIKGPAVAAPAAPETKPAPPVASPAPAPRNYEIEFGFDKARVSLANRAVIDGIIGTWRNENVVFEIVGHADTAGPATYNRNLSRARAASVAAVFAERGIPAERLRVSATGEQDLATPTPDGTRLRANRRVVITVVSAP